MSDSVGGDQKIVHSNVIVVGSGLSGLSAAIEAARHGAEVVIIEKEKNLGGNSAKATSGMNAADSYAQEEAGIKDSVDDFISDTIKSGDGLSDAKLVDTLARNSGNAVSWLREFGVDLFSVVQLGGSSRARTHRFKPKADGKPIPVGFTIVNSLQKFIKEIDDDLKKKITVLTKHRVVNIRMNLKGTEVVGVNALDLSSNSETPVKILILAKAVVLATGGYANDHSSDSLLTKYVPHLKNFPTTNGIWATGDMVKLAHEAGFDLVNLDKVQVHPTGFIDPKNPSSPTKFLAPEALRGFGGILLKADGNRFTNELGRRDHVTKSILDNCGRYLKSESNPTTAVLLMNSQVIEKFGNGPAGFYKFKGLIQDIGNLEDVAKTINVPAERLRKVISDYAKAAADGKDEFDKKDFPTVFTDADHFLISYITPSLHYCMGGIKINPEAQVTKAGTPVAGLFAAGETTGGVHGENRLGGNSLLECVVFGRIAGKNAAHYSSDK